MRVKDIALDGVVRQNPTFRLVLGTCPTLALTTAAFNGIGMGLSVTFVLICSNVFVSLLRKIIPDKVRIPAFVLIIATFVTVVQMVLKKFMPDLYDSLGVFLPLITTNCTILGVAILVIQKEYNLLESVVFAISTALGFMLAMVLFAGIREQLATTRLPKAMQGTPIALVVAGLLALAFMGFAGIKIG